MSTLLFSGLFILLFYLALRAYQNTQNVLVKKIKIDAKQNELDPVLNILHLSDLHLENISISPEQLYEKLKDEKIDLIALTGDFLDRKRTIPKLSPYLKVLNKLDANYGIYAVLGNHDYMLRDKNLQKLIETLEENHCKVMQNESTTIDIQGKSINIIGVDDFSTKRSNLDLSYKGLAEGMNLVLTHDPNIVLEMKNYHYGYLLAGHFHGGQICYPKPYHLVKMGKLVRMNMIKGLHSQDGKPFYINEGLGQTGINVRVGSRPEITIHQLFVSEMEIESLSVV